MFYNSMYYTYRNIEIKSKNSISVISVLIVKQIFEYIFSLLSEIMHIVYNDTVNI